MVKQMWNAFAMPRARLAAHLVLMPYFTWGGVLPALCDEPSTVVDQEAAAESNTQNAQQTDIGFYALDVAREDDPNGSTLTGLRFSVGAAPAPDEYFDGRAEVSLIALMGDDQRVYRASLDVGLRRAGARPASGFTAACGRPKPRREGVILQAPEQEAPLSAKPSVVHRDPGILGGTPVFAGTRVPVQNLFDSLEAGDSLEAFLRSFPSVTREQAVATLELAREALEARARSRS